MRFGEKGHQPIKPNGRDAEAKAMNRSGQRMEIDSFSGAIIFQSTQIGRNFFETPWFGRRPALQRRCQPKPPQPLRRNAGPANRPALGHEIDLPCIGGSLRDDECEWRFGELQKRAASIVSRQKDFTRDVRCIRLRAPNGDSSGTFPTLLKIHGGKGRHGTATRQKDQEDRKVEPGGSTGGKPASVTRGNH
jgi:hypothetical protein